jgi:hypothetical protein
VQADVHDQLVLSTSAPTGLRDDCEKVPSLQKAYELMIERIQLLASHSLASMMVLFDFPSKCIAPLQHRTRSAWLYIGENDTTRLECGRGSDLDPKMVDTILTKLSPDLIFADFVIPPTVCASICFEQAAQSKLLKELPTLEDIDVAVQ